MLEREATPILPPRPLQPFTGVSLIVAGALGGLVLWYAMYPSMYYLTWIIAVTVLWGVTFAVPVVRWLVALGVSRIQGVDLRVEPRGWGLLLGWLLLVTLAVGLELPLRASFALARSGFEEDLAAERAGESHHNHWRMPYYVSGVEPGRCDPERTLFVLENDTESAFVHSPGGIEGLCYNSGNTGHLYGDWYWMTED